MSNQEQSSLKQQQQQTNLYLSAKQHHKHNQCNKDNNRKKKITYQYLFTRFAQIHHLKIEYIIEIQNKTKYKNIKTNN